MRNIRTGWDPDWPSRRFPPHVALDLGVPASRIDQIAKGKRSISADTAVRLSLYFGNSAEFWLNLQSSYDLNVEKDRLPQIRRQVWVPVAQ
jgi:addiction module HigA family antidote